MTVSCYLFSEFVVDYVKMVLLLAKRKSPWHSFARATASLFSLVVLGALMVVLEHLGLSLKPFRSHVIIQQSRPLSLIARQPISRWQ